MQIYKPDGRVLADVNVEDASTLVRGIMQIGTLTLIFKIDKALEFGSRDYVVYEGRRYYLYRSPEVRKVATSWLEYTATFHEIAMSLDDILIKDESKPARTKFVFSGKPSDFIRLIVRNMGDGWSVGETIDKEDQTIAFSGQSCHNALGVIAQTFETEWEVEGRRIHLRKVEHDKATPLPLSYGKGNGFVSGVSRIGSNDKQVGRLYVEGGERNIDPAKYKARALMLPKAARLEYQGRTYRTDADGTYVYRQGSDVITQAAVALTQIYPKRVGTLTGVTVVDESKHFYDVVDTGIPADLNYSQYRIPGQKAVIKFESGMLAGREFEIKQTDKALTGYHHDTRRFEVVPQEIDDIVMPGGIFVPRVGDKYAIFNIDLPEAYTRAAADELFREAVKQLADRSEPMYEFGGKLDAVWSTRRWLEIGGKIKPGGHVLFSDPEFHPDGTVIRIVSVTQHLNNPTAPEMTLSNTTVSGSFGTTISKLEAQEVLIDKGIKDMYKYSERQWQHVKETQDALKGMADQLGYDKPITPILAQMMQLIVGDERLQYRFVRSRGDLTPVVHEITHKVEGAQLIAPEGTIQHMTIGIDAISSAHTGYKVWDVARYESPALEAKKTYYLYIKAPISGTSATYRLETAPIAMDADAGYYNLLVGLSVDGLEGRSFARLHGFTEILPGRITTPRLVSPDGRDYVDFEGKRYHFGWDGGYLDINSMGDGKTRLKGALIAVGDKDTSLEDYIDSIKPKDGRGVSKVIPRYAAGTSYEAPLYGFRDTFGEALSDMTEDKDCIWCYEVVSYTDGTSSTPTELRICYTRSKDGKDGKDAHSPKIIGGTWWVWDDAQGRYIDTHDSAQGESGENGKSPKIQNGTWWVWDGAKWVDTGVKAMGQDGRDGVGIDEVIELYGAGTETQEPTGWFLGHWQVTLTEEKPCLWNKELIKWSNGGLPTESRKHVVYRKAKDGAPGSIISDIIEWYAVSNSDTVAPPDQAWTKNTQKISPEKPYLWNYTETLIEGRESIKSPKIVIGRWGSDGKPGTPGSDGKDAHSPKIIGGTWWVWDDAQGRYVDTHDPAQGESGENGKSPKIQSGTWWVWDGEKWVDTGVKAKGDKGKDGRGVSSVVKEWAKTTDPDNPPSEGSPLWSAIPPKPEPGKYIWERTTTTYTQGAPTRTTPIRVELTGVSKALAEAFETSTEIKGGLVATTMLLVRNALGKIRAYFSGAGNKTNDIAFAAGVENFGLPNETQATYIKQNGDAKFGEMYMDANGQVYAMKGGQRYLIVGGQIPTLPQLLAGQGDDVTAQGVESRLYVGENKIYFADISGSITVYNADATITVEGRLSADRDVDMENSFGEPSPIWLKIGLYKGDTLVHEVARASVEDYAEVINLYYKVPTPGTYRLRCLMDFTQKDTYSSGFVRCKFSGFVHGMYPGSGSYAHFSGGGLALSQGVDNFLLFDKNGLQLGTKTKMPGVLAAGCVDFRGRVQTYWGSLVNRQGHILPGANKFSTGVYVVYHSIPHRSYIPTVTCMDEDGVSAYVRSSEILPYQFTVRVFGTNSQNPYDSGFSYQLVGSP